MFLCSTMLVAFFLRLVIFFFSSRVSSCSFVCWVSTSHCHLIASSAHSHIHTHTHIAYTVVVIVCCIRWLCCCVDAAAIVAPRCHHPALVELDLLRSFDLTNLVLCTAHFMLAINFVLCKNKFVLFIDYSR